jgi:hypothetical protein
MLLTGKAVCGGADHGASASTKMPPSGSDDIGAITGDRARNWFTCFKRRASRPLRLG